MWPALRSNATRVSEYHGSLYPAAQTDVMKALSGYAAVQQSLLYAGSEHAEQILAAFSEVVLALDALEVGFRKMALDVRRDLYALQQQVCAASVRAARPGDSSAPTLSADRLEKLQRGLLLLDDVESLESVVDMYATEVASKQQQWAVFVATSAAASVSSAEWEALETAIGQPVFIHPQRIEQILDIALMHCNVFGSSSSSSSSVCRSVDKPLQHATSKQSKQGSK